MTAGGNLDRDAPGPRSRGPPRHHERRARRVGRLLAGRTPGRLRAAASPARRSSSTAPPTATPSTARLRSRRCSATRPPRPSNPGGDAAQRRQRAVARPPRSPTTSRDRSSTRGRATRLVRAGARRDHPDPVGRPLLRRQGRGSAAGLGEPGEGPDPASGRAATTAREHDPQMEQDRAPLPRFWYLPRGEKAAVVITGDDHGNGGTAGRFDAETAHSPPAARWRTGSACAARRTCTRARR